LIGKQTREMEITTVPQWTQNCRWKIWTTAPVIIKPQISSWNVLATIV